MHDQKKPTTTRLRRMRLVVAALALAFTGIAASTQVTSAVETEEARWSVKAEKVDVGQDVDASTSTSRWGGAWA